jgi:hypothetical protein
MAVGRLCVAFGITLNLNISFFWLAYNGEVDKKGFTGRRVHWKGRFI